MRETSDILKCVAEHFRVAPESVTMASSLVYDLGADSSDFLELCIELSETFDCEFETQALSEVRTVGDLYRLLQQTLLT